MSETNTIPSPAQRIAARGIANAILADAVRSGDIRRADWVGSEAHQLRSALIEADYRDSFPDSYPVAEVEAARLLIIKIATTV